MKQFNQTTFKKLTIALLTSAALQGMPVTHGAAAAGGGGGGGWGGAYSRDDEAFSRGIAALSSSSVREISAKIHEYLPLAEAVRGKDITVFVGNTGSGKSTTLNLLAGNVLVTNRFGDIELAPGAAGLPVGAGGTSVTAYPQSIQSPALGILFDMPGFEDTGGAVKDLLNAGLMKAILERAGTVKVALVVSKAEVEAIRTKGLQAVMKHIRLFPEDFLETSLCMVMTKATSATIARSEIKGDWFAEHAIPGGASWGSSFLRRLLHDHKIGVVPQADETYTIDRLQSEYKGYLEHHLRRVVGLKPSTIRMEMTLSTDSSLELEKYFGMVFIETLKEMVETEWKRSGKTSVTLEAEKEIYKRQLVDRVERNEGVNILKPLGEAQFRKVIREFTASDGLFITSFNAFVSGLKAKEAEERGVIAQRNMAEAAERERIAREAERKAIEERNEARAAEEKAKAESAAAEKRASEAEAARARAEAARARAEEEANDRQREEMFFGIFGTIAKSVCSVM